MKHSELRTLIRKGRRAGEPGLALARLHAGRTVFEDAWTSPLRAMEDGSCYLDQVRLGLKGRRLRHASEDAWILHLDRVKAAGGAHVG